MMTATLAFFLSPPTRSRSPAGRSLRPTTPDQSKGPVSPHEWSSRRRLSAIRKPDTPFSSLAVVLRAPLAL
jgi:hypothetical protein